MAFSYSLRSNDIFMYITNVKHFGHLVNSVGYETHHFRNDLYEVKRNQLDWEKQYLHSDYQEVLKETFDIEQPCPDVYWFPLMSPTFCKHLVEEMENYGKWSDGKNNVKIAVYMNVLIKTELYVLFSTDRFQGFWVATKMYLLKIFT